MGGRLLAEGSEELIEERERERDGKGMDNIDHIHRAAMFSFCKMENKEVVFKDLPKV